MLWACVSVVVVVAVAAVVVVAVVALAPAHLFADRTKTTREIRETFGVVGEFSAEERAAVQAKYPFLAQAEAVRFLCFFGSGIWCW